MATIKLPGLIDVHVHLRDPGQTHKEDFTTGTSAALAGGFTTVVDMPNNAEPIISVERQESKREKAGGMVVSDIGFHYGSMGENLDTFEEAAKLSVGLKLYLNNTTGGYVLDPENLKKIYAAWPKDQVVLLHAEEDFIDVAIESLEGLNRPVHICHMPSKEILEKIIEAKKQGIPLTCGVCAHHLFLTEKSLDDIGVYGDMLPSLKTAEDQQYLWDNLDNIDVFESDHAPHTHEEKKEGAHGVPGLETTLPLLLRAEAEGKITREQIIEKCHTNPAKIFGIATDDDTYVEVDMTPTTIKNENLKTKCGWSPFDGWEVPGQVSKVVIRGETVFESGEVKVEPGDGTIIEFAS